jgi:hypothetical protein
MKLEINDRIVVLPEGRLEFELPVLEAILVENQLLVIHDYMASPQDKPARNLVSYSMSGQRLWVADNPSTSTSDAYTNFLSEQPLRVGNFAGYECVISLSTGRLESSAFIK